MTIETRDPANPRIAPEPGLRHWRLHACHCVRVIEQKGERFVALSDQMSTEPPLMPWWDAGGMIEILVLRSRHVRDATKLLSGTAATSAWEVSANFVQGSSHFVELANVSIQMRHVTTGKLTDLGWANFAVARDLNPRRQ